MRNKPMTIKIFEKLLIPDGKLTSTNVAKIFNLNSKSGLQILDVLKANNKIIQKYETHIGKFRFNCFTIHDNLNTMSIEELNLLDNMLDEYTIIDYQFKQEFKKRIGRYDEKYNDGRFYYRKAKRLGYYKKTITFNKPMAVIFKHTPNMESEEFKSFQNKYIEMTENHNQIVETGHTKRVRVNELSDYCCYDKNRLFGIKKDEENEELRKEILKYCIFPQFSVPKDNGYVETFSELANETINFLSEEQNNHLDHFELKKEIYYKMTLHTLLKVIPLNVRNGRTKIFLYILSLITENIKIARLFYFLECKNMNMSISKKILENEDLLIERVSSIYKSHEKQYELIKEEKNINYILKKIKFEEIENLRQKNVIIISLKSYITFKILKRTKKILQICEIPFSVEKNIKGQVKNKAGIKIDKIETTIIIKTNLKENKTLAMERIKETREFKLMISKEFKNLYKITLPIEERIKFYEKLNLIDINNFISSFNQAVYTTKSDTLDKQKYWSSRLTNLKSHSKYQLLGIKTIKLTKNEQNKLFKLKKYILKYKKLPPIEDNGFSQKLLKNLREQRILSEMSINSEFFRMKYENLKNMSCIPIKKISSNVFIENIYYLLLQRGSLDIKSVAKELEFFTDFEVLKAVKRSDFFEIKRSGKSICINIK